MNSTNTSENSTATASHTPGPWQIEIHRCNADIFYEDGLLRSCIATLDDARLCRAHGTLQANARLIAASPELLAALQACIPILEKEYLSRTDPLDLAFPELDHARTAIAKATHA